MLQEDSGSRFAPPVVEPSNCKVMVAAPLLQYSSLTNGLPTGKHTPRRRQAIRNTVRSFNLAGFVFTFNTAIELHHCTAADQVADTEGLGDMLTVAVEHNPTGHEP